MIKYHPASETWWLGLDPARPLNPPSGWNTCQGFGILTFMNKPHFDLILDNKLSAQIEINIKANKKN